MPDDDALMVIQAVRGDIGTKWRGLFYTYLFDDFAKKYYFFSLFSRMLRRP